SYEDPQNKNTITVFAMNGGGPGKELYVREHSAAQGVGSTAGSVHHVAFRVKDEEEIKQWIDWLDKNGIPNSSIVDRFYFKSLYFRISQGILFELATDGPGFSADEAIEHLGERLSLPPFLEIHRTNIEAGLEPL
ncbi:VOC family protein, partial [Patescibacteria group bacterium]|nr:VOC family protein [Patescibacteria group bacterium]